MGTITHFYQSVCRTKKNSTYQLIITRLFKLLRVLLVESELTRLFVILLTEMQVIKSQYLAVITKRENASMYE